MKLQKITKEEKEKYQSLNIEEKIELSKSVIKESLKNFDQEKVAIAWTGGKDSTLMLWLVKKTLEEKKEKLPRTLFIDEGDVFEEIWDFVKKIKKQWSLDFSVSHNKDVSSKAKKIGDPIKVADLNERNQKEIKKLDFKDKEFLYQPESFVGNHLMKTVATNMWIEKNKMDALFVGVRWDEQKARAQDDFLREIGKPPHFRIEPILPFREKDVWEAIHKKSIPYVKLYKKGYRSLGAKTTTNKSANKPAWKQDLENTTERAGRQQDKEKIMEKLRKLGYM